MTDIYVRMPELPPIDLNSANPAPEISTINPNKKTARRLERDAALLSFPREHEVVTPEELHEEGIHTGSKGSLETRISRLRSRLPDGAIVSHRGIGYSLRRR